MTSRLRAAIVLTLPATLFICGKARAQMPTTERVSVSSSGAQGNAESVSPSISVDGRFVAFRSVASNLVAGDTNAVSDVFVRDRVTGTTQRVSVDSTGAQANGDSGQPSISADGNFVAFHSLASNLVAGDTNASGDIFVHDRTTGATERVSVDSSGAQANRPSYLPSMSADGRFVVFYGDASNLVPGDTSLSNDVFVHDRTSSTTEFVSVDSTGAHGDSHSFYPSISADGRWIAFDSDSTNLAPGDTNGVTDIFLHDRVNGTTERVSMDSAEIEGDANSHLSSVSADGRFVAFGSFATNLVTGDVNGFGDIFVRDRLNGITERVSVDGLAGEANEYSSYPSISADGGLVAFRSTAWNLVFGDTNAVDDVFVRNRLSGTTERVSVDSSGVEANSFSLLAAISPDGRFVAFWTWASNLVAGDTNSAADILVRDRGSVPKVYCTSSTTSHGCSPSVTATANPSLLSVNPCNITVANVEGLKSGILFYGVNNTGFTPTPWAIGSGSYLCVKQPTQRTPIQNSGGTLNACNGSLVLDWNAYQSAQPFALGNPWSVGDKIYMQAWFRDPPAPKGTNLSNAVELTYVP